MSTPAEDGFYMPPEWARHERCWIAWPCLPERWPGGLSAARHVHLDVARAISMFEPVTILAPPDEVAELGLHVCDHDIEILPMALKDGWFRDTGPTFLVNGQGGIAGVNWHFNSWGTGKDTYDADRDLAANLLQHMQIKCYDAPIVTEGGAIHTDGQGTLLCVEAAIIDTNRNPGMTRDAAEQILLEYTGAKKIIWLPRGFEGDETGGHVDIVAAFAAPGVVLVNWTEDENDRNHVTYSENRAILEGAVDAQGRRLQVVPLPQPAPDYEDHGDRLTLSYMNFYIANGGIVMPAFEQASDKEAAKVLAGVFPEHEIVEVPATELFRGGGGIHCITQQQPWAAGEGGRN